MLTLIGRGLATAALKGVVFTRFLGEDSLSCLTAEDGKAFVRETGS